jgi:hypothetical protein
MFEEHSSSKNRLPCVGNGIADSNIINKVIISSRKERHLPQSSLPVMQLLKNIRGQSFW